MNINECVNVHKANFYDKLKDLIQKEQLRKTFYKDFYELTINNLMNAKLDVSKKDRNSYYILQNMTF